MFFCYLDESGTDDKGSRSHYLLAGLAIPDSSWKGYEQSIAKIKTKYLLDGQEIHTAWMVRQYREQSAIRNFEQLPHAARRYEVELRRNTKLNALRVSNSNLYKSTRKIYDKTAPYIHLSHTERLALLSELADLIAGWSHCRLFAECIDKTHFNKAVVAQAIDEQALEQVVSRFDAFLSILSKSSKSKHFGVLIHDNNPTVSKKHTDLMNKFHLQGTLWRSIDSVVETPMFVDSKLTAMIQLADLCSYSLRKYLEGGDATLFKKVFKRADSKDGKVVGVRHFCGPVCSCLICKRHKLPPAKRQSST